MNGGYSMIDFDDLDLSALDDGSVAKQGIYAKAKAAVETGKPMVLHGIKNSTQKFTPITAYGGSESSTSVFLSFFPITLHINSSDEITM